MANRYWKQPSSPTFLWTDTANWSTSDGGAGGASVPGAGDDVFFTDSSVTFAGTTVVVMIPASTTVTVNSLTKVASGSSTEFFFRSDTWGVQATISASTVTISACNFMDIVGAGSGTWAGTEIGDVGGNSGITFTPAVSRYWVGGTGSWIRGSTTNWSATSGGANGATVPLPQDTVFFDSNSFSAPGQIVTVYVATRINGRNYFIPSMDWTGVTNSPTLNWYGNSILGTFEPFFITGDVTFSSAMSITNANDRSDVYFTKHGTLTVDTGGLTLKFPSRGISSDSAYIVHVACPGGTFRLLGDMTVNALAGGTWVLEHGTFDANNFDVTLASFSSDNSNTRGILMGSGTWTMLGAASTVWDMATTTNLTFDSGTSSLIFDRTTIIGSPGLGFYGGGLTYYDVTFVKAGYLDVTNIYGDNTFNTLSLQTYSNYFQSGTTYYFDSGSTQTTTALVITGTSDYPVILRSSVAGSYVYMSAASTNITYAQAMDNTALGAAIPFDATDNGTDLGHNTNWCFTDILTCIVVGSLSQTNLNLTSGDTYRLRANNTSADGSLVVREDSTTIGTISTPGVSTITFTSVGGDTLSFTPSADFSGSVDNVTLKQVLQSAVEDNIPVKEFLTGNTDEGRDIVFRADTQTMQLQAGAELYSTPLAVITETERGSMMKAFVSLDDGAFYEVEGTVTKGVSLLKLTGPLADKTETPMAKSIQVSYRDSSAQLCRILQMAVVATPTTIDHAP